MLTCDLINPNRYLFSERSNRKKKVVQKVLRRTGEIFLIDLSMNDSIAIAIAILYNYLSVVFITN